MTPAQSLQGYRKHEVHVLHDGRFSQIITVGGHHDHATEANYQPRRTDTSECGPRPAKAYDATSETRNMVSRFNIELPDDYRVIVEQLRQKAHLRNQKDVFENAIALLGWAVREASRGRVIASIDEKSQTYAEMHMPALMNVSHEEDHETAAQASEPRSLARTSLRKRALAV